MPNYAPLLGSAGGANAPILGLNKRKPQGRSSIGPVGGMRPGPTEVGGGFAGGGDYNFLPDNGPGDPQSIAPIQMGGHDEGMIDFGGPGLTPPQASGGQQDAAGGGSAFPSFAGYGGMNPYSGYGMGGYGGYGGGMGGYGGFGGGMGPYSGYGGGMGMGYGGFNPYSMFRPSAMGGMRISPWASMLGGGGGFGGYGGMSPFMGMQMPQYY